MTATLDVLKKWYETREEQIVKDFCDFLSFPSISTDPSHNQDLRDTASWLADYLKKSGLETTIWETTGHPVVFGTYMKAGPHRPTVLIYQHYDVQPVDPLDKWHADPFKPVVKNNQIYARGASDNKGQCFYSINAIRAFIELSEKIGVNIKIFIEGEEETGGGGTTGLLPQKKEELKADYLLLIDFDLPSADVPAITLGMRGIVTMNVECRNSTSDLHSGVHGGIVLNPNRALVSLLAKMWDASGSVVIPGFYDNIRPLSEDERSLIDMTFEQESYIKGFGVKAFAPEPGYSPVESCWIRPTLEINGINGGYSGPGFKTVIPAMATAKISCRLVPDQDPDKIAKSVANFLQQNAPQGLDIKVELQHGAKAYRSPLDSPLAKIAAKAYEETFGKQCKFQLCGGSLPIVTELAPISGADALMMGFGLATDDIHAPNEHFGLDRFKKGFLTVARILAQLSG